MQIIKPKHLGLLNKTYQLGHHQFAVGALAFFKLGEAGPLLQEYEQWARFGSQLPPGVVLDMGFAKPRAEVLVCGQGHAYRHGLLLRAKPRVSLGKLRHGVSLSKKQQTAGVVEALAPIDITDKRRSRYNGRYDKQWLETVHPGLPLDTDPRLFNAADNKQQLKKGFFSPGQHYQLRDLHPECQLLEGQTPDIDARIFINQRVGDEEEFHELSVNLETLWFFPEIELGIALYRGVAEVADSDGLDVKQLMLACEKAGDEPRPLDYYRQVLALRSNPETAVGHLFNESQLMPKKTQEEEAQIARLYSEALAQQQQQSQQQREQYKQQAMEDINAAVAVPFPGQEKMQAALTGEGDEQEQNGDAAEAEDDALDIAPIPEAMIAAGDFDLTPVIEQARALEEKLNSEAAAKQEQMQALAKSYTDKYADKLEPQTESLDDLRERVFDPVFVQAQDLRDKLSPDINQDKLVALLQKVPADTREKMEREGTLNWQTLQLASEQMAASQKQARQSAPDIMTPVSLCAQGQAAMREWVEQLLADDECLAGRDLAGADLSGLDFSGRDLRDLMLEGCDLRGCNFSGAQMQGVALVAARLDGACFDGAVLDAANICKATGRGVGLRQTSLNSSLFNAAELIQCDFSGAKGSQLAAQEADFSESCFDQTRLSDSIFSLANLTASSWSAAQVNKSIFLQATLESSNWSEAKLQRCMIIDVKGRGVRFSRAELDTVQFSNVGDLSEANFSGAIVKVCGFRGVDLSHWQAPMAVFVDCDFSEAKLLQAQLQEVLFKGGVAMQTDWSGSDCSDALFSEVILRKSIFETVDLRRAEFNNCALSEVEFNHCETHKLKRYPLASIG